MKTTQGLELKILVGFLILVANSGYLAAFATPSLFYVGNVLLHVVLGTVLLAAVAPRTRTLLRNSGRSGKLGWLAAPALAVAAGTGLYLTLAGNLRPMQPVLITHIVAATVGAVLVVVALSRRLPIAIVSAAILLPVGVEILARPGGDDLEVNRELPPLTMEGEAMGGRDGPFFPSSAETRDGNLIPARFFMDSASCGESDCHPDIFEQWESSAHRRASFNNQWYRKSVEYMQTVVGTTPSKWCGGCHDHALLFSGLMDEPIEELIDLPEAHAGLSCTSCHSIVAVKNTMGNGGFVIEYPPLHDLATSDNRLMRALHDFVLRLDPEPHRRVFLKPFHQGDNSAFCSTCHKVHLDEPVNHYRWLRGFNEYDNWQASGVSGEGARSFYYPEEPMSCSHCHMARVPSQDAGNRSGMVHSHRFAAANTALPVAYQDDEQLEAVIDFLQAGQVTVDLFALVRGGDTPQSLESVASGGPRRLASTFAVGEEAQLVVPTRTAAPAVREEIFAPLERAPTALVRGESVRIDAVVRTRNVGHFFPGGTVDAYDVWLELRAVDNEGRVIFWSGQVDNGGKGPVEETAHFYRSLMLDGRGNPINKRNVWAARSVLYIRLIPPGAADTVRFRLEVPDDCGSEITLEAKLNYRKFAWWNTQWAYAGRRDPSHIDFSVGPDHDEGRFLFDGPTDNVSGVLKQIPDLPIVTMAETEVTLPVESMEQEPAPIGSPQPEDALRWNDYGIGLFLQGDLRGAEQAFLRVTELTPDYADGWVNVARVRAQEGDPEGAQQMLDKALALEPNLAKAHYFYGLALKTMGLYEEALEHLHRAADAYPRDRVVQNQIGRLLFLQRNYDRAIEELSETLKIDPENLAAHYNLMLAYQGSGDGEKADLHKKLYLRFKADEASQFLTGGYRRAHPADNNERQPIHEHRSGDRDP